MLVWLQYNKVLPPADHLLESALFIPHFSPEHPKEIWPFLIPGWTLNFEAFFYAVFALTLLLPRRTQLTALAALLWGLVLVGTLLRPQGAVALTYTSPLLLEFLAGALIGRMFERGFLFDGRADLIVIRIALAVLAGSSFAIRETSWARVMLWGAPSALIVLAALGLKLRGNGIAPVILGLLGDASYSIYLSHFPLLAVAHYLAATANLPPAPIYAVPFFMVIGSTVAVAGGCLLYRCIERPIQRLAGRWPRR